MPYCSQVFVVAVKFLAEGSLAATLAASFAVGCGAVIGAVPVPRAALAVAAVAGVASGVGWGVFAISQKR